jgi:predicted dinucleotide-binding enzyme
MVHDWRKVAVKISIIGSGSMGQALGKFFAQAGHDILFGSRTPQRINAWIAAEGLTARSGSYAEATQFGDIVLLATRWADTPAALQAAGSLAGKIVVDCANPSGADGLYHVGDGRMRSGAEEIAQWAVGAKVVLALNNLYGSMLLAGTQFGEEKPSAFYCGDDAAAKAVVAQLLHEAGLDPVDAGALKHARYLEPLAGLMAHLGENMGWGGENIAYKFLRRRRV